MKLKALRTDCCTGAVAETEQTITLVWHDSMQEWGVRISPGVTGYESFLIKDLLKHHNGHWTACAGTERVWDKLVISEDEMNRLYEELRWLEPLLNLVPQRQPIGDQD